MYKVGDLVVYGNTGVCRVTEIAERSPKEAGEEQLFYVLKPLYQNCTIFTPVNNPKVLMRPIITRNEAERLIDMIPAIHAEIYHCRITNKLAEHYNELLKTSDCLDLLKLCKSLYTKKRILEKENRKFGTVDERFMKRAEELLFGELAAALDIDKEQVPAYIAERMGKKGRKG